MQAVFLHTIDDVKHCLKHGLQKDAKLFSTDIVVVYYLKHHYGLECCNLCSLIDATEYLDIQKYTLQTCTTLLDELDQYLAPELNQRLGVSMRYFKPLYSFWGALQFALYVLFTRCLSRMQQQFQWDTILIYDIRLGPFCCPIEDFLSSMFPEFQYYLINYKNNAPSMKTMICCIDVDEMCQLLQERNDQTSDRTVLRQHGVSGVNVLAFEPLDRLQFLVKAGEKNNIYAFNPWNSKTRNEPEFEIDQLVLPSNESLQTICLVQTNIKAALTLLYETIKDNFCTNIVQYLQIIYDCKRKFEDIPLQCVYWEEPPSQGVSALLIEYFMTQQVCKIIGLQSQNTFFLGQVIYPYASVHVFDRCNYYLTQGTKQEEMAALYPQISNTVKIIPPAVLSGFEGAKSTNFSHKPLVDVAIYLDWTFSFSQTSLIPMEAEVQDALLTFLEAQQNKKIHVVVRDKPSYGFCAMLSKFKLLNNVILIKDASINDYVMKYAPKVIVMSSLIPDLGNIVFEDITIVIIKNKPYVFDDSILNVVNKRIFYVDQLEEAKILLQKSFNGTLDKIRDNTYGIKFCNQGSLEEQLADIIDNSNALEVFHE